MDFVEVPSILMEYFSKSPEVLASIGKHFKTQEPVPMNMIKARQQNQKILNSLETQNQLQMALLDQAYHSELALKPDFNTSEIMYSLSKRMNPLAIPRPSQWQVQFSHLFTYGASYYTYSYSRRWASRIFQKHFAGSRDSWRTGGKLLRSEVLGVGGGRDPWIGLEKIGVVNTNERKDSSVTDLP
jgi:intermediate peptidase